MLKERMAATIMLEAIDELAPVCVDWNNEELWIKAITKGLRRIKAVEAEAPLARTMTNGDLYRFAWAAVRQAIANTRKWKEPDEEEIRRLQVQEKELKELMEKSCAGQAGLKLEVKDDE